MPSAHPLTRGETVRLVLEDGSDIAEAVEVSSYGTDQIVVELVTNGQGPAAITGVELCGNQFQITLTRDWNR